VLDPALHAVFVAVFAVSVTLVVAGLVMPSRVRSPDEEAQVTDE